jgi:hypothetical protein
MEIDIDLYEKGMSDTYGVPYEEWMTMRNGMDFIEYMMDGMSYEPKLELLRRIMWNMDNGVENLSEYVKQNRVEHILIRMLFIEQMYPFMKKENIDLFLAYYDEF